MLEDRLAYRDDGQHSASPCVAQQDVDEGYDLQSFPQAHAVSQDAAKATAVSIALQ